ncbi:hypothetical protein ACJK9F_002976 [Lelliottia nimipressuralis]|uniref:hypothetical protein n=1 Tax=Lelliottia nimipressuralis TaxID=69220 RepID=UPI003905EFED
MKPAQGNDVPLDFPHHRIVRENPNKTGGPGGGGMDNLERRVSALEDDVKVIRNDLTTLMVRSENFATKADISNIRTEIATLSGSLRKETAEQGGALRAEMAEIRGEIKTEMAALRGELKAAMVESQQSILKAIEEKSRWKWGTVFIPLVVGVAAVLATLFAAHLSG